MYVRPYKHEPSALLEALDHIAPDPSDLKFTKRVEVVSMVLRGEKTTAQAAAESGFSLRSVQGWVRSVDENGWDSLRSAPPHGRPCRLSAAQLGEVRRAVRGDPCEKGYCWWSGTTVADYIRKTYGIEYGTGAALCLIKRLKLRPLMDARTSVGSDDSQQEALHQMVLRRRLLHRMALRRKPLHWIPLRRRPLHRMIPRKEIPVPKMHLRMGLHPEHQGGYSGSRTERRIPPMSRGQSFSSFGHYLKVLPDWEHPMFMTCRVIFLTGIWSFTTGRCGARQAKAGPASWRYVCAC